jgi:thioredoxin reductase
VYYGAALTEAFAYRGMDVLVVGGANSAGQGAMFFSRYAATTSERYSILQASSKVRRGLRALYRHHFLPACILLPALRFFSSRGPS